MDVSCDIPARYRKVSRHLLKADLAAGFTLARAAQNAHAEGLGVHAQLLLNEARNALHDAHRLATTLGETAPDEFDATLAPLRRIIEETEQPA